MNKSDIQSMIDFMLKNGTVNDEFPELAGAVITDMRPGGDETDPDVVVELAEMGWPIIVVRVNGEDCYGIPKSFRERVDAKTQNIKSIN